MPNLYVGGRSAPESLILDFCCIPIAFSHASASTRVYKVPRREAGVKRPRVSGTQVSGLQFSSRKISFRRTSRSIESQHENFSCNYVICFFLFRTFSKLDTSKPSNLFATPVRPLSRAKLRSEAFPAEKQHPRNSRNTRSSLRSPFTGHPVCTLRFLPALARLHPVPRARKTRGLTRLTCRLHAHLPFPTLLRHVRTRSARGASSFPRRPCRTSRSAREYAQATTIRCV